MSKKRIARICFYLVVGIILYSLFWAVSKHNDRLTKIVNLPRIEALTLSGEDFVSTEILDSTKRTALVFFHPGCEFCRKELEGIIARHQECKNVQWLFLTLAPSPEVELFMIKYPLESIPNAFVLREDWPLNYKLFDVKAPPALFLYDEKGKLLKRYKGATSINSIVKGFQ